MADKKEVRYINKDFFSLREALINFTKVYFPNNYRDFNEASPGMMFIEMAAYIGDVLSYYTDKQFKESLFLYSNELETVLNFSYLLGYKPKLIVPASTDIDVFQLIPSNGVGGSGNAPDWRYATNIRQGAVVSSDTNSNVFFRTTEDCDFRISSSFVSNTDSSNEQTTITVYSLNAGSPDYYLLKKRVKVVAGQLKSETFSFGEPERFAKILLSDTEVTEILSAIDGDGNTWYELPFLAQDTILQSVQNTLVYDPTYAMYFQDTPYLLKLLKVPRRFETRVRPDGKMELRFGSGISDSADEEITPNTQLLSSTLPDGNVNFSQTINPTNFLFTKTYGQIPNNTTLTVSYYSGGGIESNVSQGDLTKLVEIVVDLDESGLDSALVSQVRNSIACNNPIPATGGRGADTVDEIKMNSMMQYASQNRAVTRDDYIVRTLSMHPKFGSVAKVHILQDTQIDSKTSTTIPNPLALNLYVLGYDVTGKLTQLNVATKQNLKTYLNQYRMLTDAINILDAFIINIGVDYKIVTIPKYNKNEVLLRTIDKVKNFFSIEKWEINQPIILSDLVNAIVSVEGVQSVIGDPSIYCRWETSQGYSGNLYSTEQATINGVVYPPLDPSVFEIRFPDSDIRGKVVTY
jgi:hypothetical protein